MASSQHRCVFAGNIPYDATEEQLVEICQEVGPVVKFRNQLNAHPKPPVQRRIQLQRHPSNHVVKLGTLSGQSNLMHPSGRPLPLGSLSVTPPIQLETSTSLNQQMHAFLRQHSVHVGSSTVGHNIQMVRPDASFQVFLLEDLNWAKRSSTSTYSNMPLGLVEKTNVVNDSSESFTRFSKLMKLDEGRGTLLSADVPVTNRSSHVLGSGMLPVHAAPNAEVQYSEQETSPSQLPSNVESILLQKSVESNTRAAELFVTGAATTGDSAPAHSSARSDVALIADRNT